MDKQNKDADLPETEDAPLPETEEGIATLSDDDGVTTEEVDTPVVVPEEVLPVPRLIQHINTHTLLGDVRDAILDRIRNLPKPYASLSESAQYEIIAWAESVARNLVTQTVYLIASEGRVVIKGMLDKVVIKDGVQATIKLSKNDEALNDLVQSQGQDILIVVASDEEFLGQKAPAHAEKDQKEMFSEEDFDFRVDESTEGTVEDSDGDHQGEDAAEAPEENDGVAENSDASAQTEGEVTNGKL